MADLLKTMTAAPAVPASLKNRQIEEKAKSLLLAILEESSRRQEPRTSDNWRELVQLVRQPVLSIVKYVLGIVDTEDQRDMFQQVMLRFYRYHLSYDSSRPLLPWLYAIARNVKSDWMKTSLLLGAESLLIGEEPAPAAPQTSDHLTAKLTVKALFAQLPEDDRQILWLFYYEGMTEAEISAHLNIPLSTTKFYLRRAKKRAREILTAHPRRQANEA
jgi:RNA polymerase sigma factor (sigma-70 family)